MNHPITKLLLLAALSFPMAGCSEDSSSTNSVAQDPAQMKVVEKDGWRYANPLCVPDDNPYVDCIASRNDKFLRDYTGGKEWRLEWIKANNSRVVIPANAGHDHVIPANTWIAHKKRGEW